MNTRKFFKKSIIYALFAALLLGASQSSVNAQWVSQGLIPHEGDSYIHVIDANSVIVVPSYPDSPRAWLSTNGGINWTQMGTNGLGTVPFSCVSATNINNIFCGDVGSSAIGGDAKVWRTTNQGASWIAVVNSGGIDGYITGIVFSKGNINHGVIHSDPATPGGQHIFWKTIDGGNTWTQVLAPSTGGWGGGSVGCIDDQFYWNGTNQGPPRIIVTTNGGSSFSIHNLGLTGDFVTGIAIKSDKLWGIAATYSSLPNIARTTDGGVTWTQINTGAGPTQLAGAKWIWGTNIIYMYMTTNIGGSVKRSSDGGMTWHTMATEGVPDLVSMEYAIEGSDIWLYAVSSAGRVIRYHDAGIVGINSLNQNVVSGYTLSQNYPNPFNPSTKISFVLPQANNVKLTVYDALGREVAVLVNEFRQAGQWSAEFNASALSSGIYFYRLEAGSFTETKKMLLIK
jgi:photosystem II stability/assembly factor-like uncharacterized protein